MYVIRNIYIIYNNNNLFSNNAGLNVKNNSRKMFLKSGMGREWSRVE